MSTMMSIVIRLVELIIRIVLIVKKIVELFIRCIGPLFVLLASTLTSSVSWIFISCIYPYYFETFTVMGILHLLIEAFLLQGVVFNYFMCVFSKPGSPPPPGDSAEERENMEQFKKEDAPRRGEGFSRFCRSCQTIKPVRSHHCHICGTCVLRMDHHCPWVSNCVGHFNHRYFYLFLLYMWLGTFYIATMTYGPFRNSTDFQVPYRGLNSRGTIVFVFVVCSAVFVAIGLMLGWHTYLVLSGQTTIEFYFNRYQQQKAVFRGQAWRNEFDLGWRGNFNQFFGKGNYFFSFLLPSIEPPPSDGITYVTYSELHSSSIGGPALV